MSKIIIKKLNEDVTSSTNKTGYKSPYLNLAGVGPRARAIAAANVPLCVWAKWEVSPYKGNVFKGLSFKEWLDTDDSLVQQKQLTKPFYILDYDLFHRCYDKGLAESFEIHDKGTDPNVYLSKIFKPDGSFIAKGVWGEIKKHWNPSYKYYTTKSTSCAALTALVDLWSLVYKEIPAHPDYPVYTYAEAKKVMEKCEEKYWQEEEEDKFQHRMWGTDVLGKKRRQRMDQGIKGSATRSKALIDHAKKLIQDKTCTQGTILFVDTVNNTSVVSAKISETGKITTIPGVPVTTLPTRFIPIYVCMRADFEKSKTDHINYHSLNSQLVRQLDLIDELVPESSPPRAGFGITDVKSLSRTAADEEPELWVFDNFDYWYVETVFVDKKDYTQDPKQDWGNDRRRIIHRDKDDYNNSYGWLWDPKRNGLEPPDPDENNTPDDENK